MPLLQVEELAVSFPSRAGRVSVVRGVGIDLLEGETLAVVGESGSGKSITCLAITGLLDRTASIEGRFSFGGVPYSPREGAPRGRGLSMIFQNPMSSLNPVMKVGTQVAEPLVYLRGMSSRVAKREVLRLFEEVGLPSNEPFFRSYPHQLSGGMRQRVMIAVALACDSRVLLADEPTTALDITVQAQILRLLKKLQVDRRMAMMIVTHDMAVVKSVADRVAVMYAGQIVEVGLRDQVLGSPRHPYTRALLAAIPRLERGHAGRLRTVSGRPPAPEEIGPGCPFATRCSQAEEACLGEPPELSPLPEGHRAVRCLLERGQA